MFVKRFLLFVCALICSFFDIQAEIERRAAFDLGSGVFKLLIADVDNETQTIVKYVFSKTLLVPLSGDLAKNNNGKFSKEIQKIAMSALHELKAAAEECDTKKYFGIATEAFRLSKNGEKLVLKFMKNEGFTIRLISQKEEAELGFATAVAHTKGNPENAIVWDIGNGSFQISWKEKNHIASYGKSLGKTPIKNIVISKVQGKQLSQKVSPNPISLDQARSAILLLTKELGEIPESLQIKMQNPMTEVYGIGAIHNSNISASSKRVTYTLDIVEALLRERVDLPDSAFNVEAPEFWVSDLIFVSTVMSYFKIPHVTNIKAFDDPNVITSGSTVGILVRPEYWL